MHGEPGVLQKYFEAGRHPEPEYPDCTREGQVSGASEIAIEATPCYGYCPTYTFVVRSDGSAEYTGQANVRFKGQRTGKVSPAVFEEVAAFALDIGFFSVLNDTYTCAVTDNETIYVSLVMNGQRKTIMHDAPSRSGPPRLQWLEYLIGLLEEKVEWATK